MKELLEEFVGEAALTVVACLSALGLVFAFAWGWGRSPLMAGGVGGALVAFLGYGGWVLLRPAGPGRRGRLAGAAAAAFAVAAVFAVYAWSCGCG